MPLQTLRRHSGSPSFDSQTLALAECTTPSTFSPLKTPPALGQEGNFGSCICFLGSFSLLMAGPKFHKTRQSLSPQRDTVSSRESMQNVREASALLGWGPRAAKRNRSNPGVARSLQGPPGPPSTSPGRRLLSVWLPALRKRTVTDQYAAQFICTHMPLVQFI